MMHLGTVPKCIIDIDLFKGRPKIHQKNIDAFKGRPKMYLKYDFNRWR